MGKLLLCDWVPVMGVNDEKGFKIQTTSTQSHLDLMGFQHLLVMELMIMNWLQIKT